MVGNKVVDGAAKAGYFFDQAAAEKTVFGGRREEKGFDIVGQGVISMRHLQLFFEIGEHSQPPQEHLGLVLAGVGDGEAVVVVDGDVAEVPHRLLDLANALGGGKQGHLVGVARHQHDHSIEQAAASGDDVYVA